MKKTHKKAIGVFGLVLVAAMTFVAAGIKTPGASAVGASATDTITVRVIGDVPKVNFDNPGEKVDTVDPNQSFKIDYENVESIEVKLDYTNSAGVTTTFVLSDPSDPAYNPNFAPGSLVQNLKLSNYGIGTFLLSVKGLGHDGVTATDILTRKFSNVISNLEVGDDGEVYADVEYNEEEVKSGEIVVYVDGKDTGIRLKIPDDLDENGRVKLPLDDELTAGDHSISIGIVAYDEHGNEVDGVVIEDNDIDIDITDVPDTNAPDSPDTGGLFRSLNISKEDYLVTGLIVFFVFGVVAFGIVARNRKNRR